MRPICSSSAYEGKRGSPTLTEWITQLRASQIRKLGSDGALQLSLFDERGPAAIQHPDYPGERLIMCQNPLLAAERPRSVAS